MSVDCCLQPAVTAKGKGAFRHVSCLLRPKPWYLSYFPIDCTYNCIFYTVLMRKCLELPEASGDRRASNVMHQNHTPQHGDVEESKQES